MVSFLALVGGENGKNRKTKTTSYQLVTYAIEAIRCERVDLIVESSKTCGSHAVFSIHVGERGALFGGDALHGNR